MTEDQKTIEDLKAILKEIEYIEYEDPDDGLQIWCPVCGGRPEREKLSRGIRAMYPSMGGKGHDKDCRLARAVYGGL